MLALGLMSGTSRDGMDASLVETDGEGLVVCLESLTLPYREDFRRELAELCTLKDKSLSAEGRKATAPAAAKLADIAFEAVEQLLQKRRDKSSRLSVVGFHGHTIFHAPERGETLQIGDSARLARLCKTSVVGNFRQQDMQHGGEGAPLAPLYHRAVARHMRCNDSALREQPLVFANIGGVANVTWIGAEQAREEEAMLAFDTGPGNALLDDWVARHTAGKKTFDADGALARKGKVCQEVLRAWLADPFFATAAPKSLDRDRFSLAPVESLSLEDGAATLTAFLVESLWLARDVFPLPPRLWLLCGGGRKNGSIVAGLQRKVVARAKGKRCESIRLVDEFGFDGDALEAQAFAYLAVRRLRGLPTAYPALTGARCASCGGDIYRPEAASVGEEAVTQKP